MMFGLLFVTLAGMGQVRGEKPLTWDVADAAGKPRTVVVKGIADGWAVVTEKAEHSVAGGDLLSLRRSSIPRPSWPTGSQAILTDGTRLAGTLSNGNDRAVTITRPRSGGAAGAAITLPFGTLDVLWLTRPPARTPSDPSKYSWLTTPRKKDVLLLASGDTRVGTLDRFEDSGAVIRFQTDGAKAPAPVATAAVVAVAFNPSLARTRPPAGAYAVATVTDGSRIRFLSATSDGEKLTGRLAAGGSLSVPLADVVALDVMQGKAKYLSELRPKAAKVEPFLDTSWPWAADRSVKGHPLRLVTPRGDETFDRGLGTHPKTTLVYDLAGKYRRFEAVVGMDAASGTRGRAVVRVLVDGKEADVPGLKALSSVAVVDVSVDVSKAKELALVVDFGSAGDVRADVNWGDARIVE